MPTKLSKIKEMYIHNNLLFRQNGGISRTVSVYMDFFQFLERFILRKGDIYFLAVAVKIAEFKRHWRPFRGCNEKSGCINKFYGL